MTDLVNKPTTSHVGPRTPPYPPPVEAGVMSLMPNTLPQVFPQHPQPLVLPQPVPTPYLGAPPRMPLLPTPVSAAGVTGVHLPTPIHLPQQVASYNDYTHSQQVTPAPKVSAADMEDKNVSPSRIPFPLTNLLFSVSPIISAEVSNFL